MNTITNIIAFLLDNLMSVAIVTFVLIIMWASIGTDVRVSNKDVEGLSRTVKSQMESLVPPKK